MFSSDEDSTGVIPGTPEKTPVGSILKGNQIQVQLLGTQLFPSNRNSSVGAVQDTPEKKGLKIQKITGLEVLWTIRF